MSLNNGLSKGRSRRNGAGSVSGADERTERRAKEARRTIERKRPDHEGAETLGQISTTESTAPESKKYSDKVKAKRRREQGSDLGAGVGILDRRTRKILKRKWGITRLHDYQARILAYLLPSVTQNSKQLEKLDPTAGRPLTQLRRLAGRSDLCVSVPAGYGKTMAYVLPIITHLRGLQLSSRENEKVQTDVNGIAQTPGVRALILVPAAELVVQVFRYFERFFEDDIEEKRASEKAGNEKAQKPPPLVSQFSVCGLTGLLSVKQEAEIMLGRGVEDGSTLRKQGAFLGCPSSAAKGPTVVIAVPTRLTQHAPPFAPSTQVDYSRLSFLIVDEADRLLKHSYANWLATFTNISELATAATRRRLAHTQTPLDRLTGTLSDPGRLVKMTLTATPNMRHDAFVRLSMVDPIHIDVRIDSERGEADGKEGGADKTVHKSTTLNRPNFRLGYLRLDRSPSASLVDAILQVQRQLGPHGEKPSKVMIFVTSDSQCRELAKALSDHIKGQRITDDSQGDQLWKGRQEVVMAAGDLRKRDRQEALAAFESGRASLFICTDVVARGIDIPDVAAVIQVGVAPDFETFAHRVGRTARNGTAGMAVAIVSDRAELRRHKQQLRTAGVEPGLSEPDGLITDERV